jgi:hypothetical protein
MSSKQPDDDLARRASLIVNVDSILIGFIVLISSVTKVEVNGPIDFYAIISGSVSLENAGQYNFMIFSMLAFTVSFILAICVMFGLPDGNQESTFWKDVSYKDLLYKSAMSMVLGLLLLMCVVYVKSFGAFGVGASFTGVSMVFVIIFFIVRGSVRKKT